MVTQDGASDQARARANRIAVSETGGLHPPFVGGSATLVATAAALSRVVTDAGQIVVVEGPAGIGKSRLLREVLHRVSDQGLLVCAGGAHELARHRPFGVVVEALGIDAASPDPRRARLARLLREDRASQLEFAPGPVEQFRIMEGLRQLVDELTAEGPVALVIDDVHWADPATLSWLHRLAYECSLLPLALVCALRGAPRDGNVELLLQRFGEVGATHVRLDALDDEHTVELAGHVLGGEPGQRLAQQLRHCGGNPLLVMEMARALDAQGSLSRQGATVELDRTASLSLGMPVLLRLGFLPRDSIEILRIATVLGPRFRLSDLVLLTGKSTLELVAAVEDGLRAETLVEVGNVLSFRHDVIRETLYEGLPSSVRAGLHAQLARALAEAGGPALTVAEHFARGAAPGDAQARRWLQRAAAEIGSRSPSAALELLNRALELTTPGDPSRDRLLVDRVAHMFSLGRFDEVEREIQSLLSTGAAGPLQAALRLVIVQMHVARGRPMEALAEVDKALHAQGLAPTEQVMLTAWTAHATFLAADLPRALSEADAAIEGAKEADAPPALIAGLAAKACTLGCAGRFAASVDVASAAVRVTEQVPDGQGYRFHSPVYLGALLLQVGRVGEAEEALRRGRRMSEQIGAAWNLPMYHFVLIFAKYLEGAWDDAIAEFDARHEFASTVETRHFVGATSLRALIALHRDGLQAAGGYLDEAAHEFERSPGQYGSAMLVLGQALLAEAQGDAATAYAMLSSTWAQLLETSFLIDLPYLGPDLARLAATTGNRRVARRVTRDLDALAAENPEAPPVPATADRARGWAEQDPQPLLAAADGYDRVGRPFERLCALEDAAGLLQPHDGADAIRYLQEASDGYVRLGAHRNLARVDAKLRALGVRRGSRGPRRRPMNGWASLTPTESSVAQLVAEGLSNPEIADRLFVSRRTVQTHVSHILRKLGHRSRVQLASEVTRRSSSLDLRHMADVSEPPVTGS